MDFLDLHPIDAYEARFKMIATLVLLSELGAVARAGTRVAKAGVSQRKRSLPPKRRISGGMRLVRPPRSC